MRGGSDRAGGRDCISSGGLFCAAGTHETRRRRDPQKSISLLASASRHLPPSPLFRTLPFVHQSRRDPRVSQSVLVARFTIPEQHERRLHGHKLSRARRARGLSSKRRTGINQGGVWHGA